GFIGFDECRYEREWSATELEALHTTASIFGSAESRARTEQKLFRRQKTLRLLQEIVGAALRSSDLPGMAETLVAELGRLISADGCFLSLWDETLKQSIPLAAYGPYKEIYRNLRPEPYERTLTSSALDHGKTLIVEDARNSPHVSKRIAAMFSATSVLVLPMKAGETRLGAIMLSFDSPHRFALDEIEISEQAAGLIALALEKFQAVEHARRRAEEAERLRKAGAVITETLEAEEAIRRILEQLAQVIPYDSASVQLLDGNELVIVGGHGWEDEKDVRGMRFPIPGDNPNTEVIESGKPLILAEAEKLYPAFHNPPHSHIRSWLGVPLIARHRTIGLLAIDSSKPNHFTPENVDSVTAFADQVAIALENARLFKETQTQAITDPLTTVYNRRGLFELGEFELARARRIHRPFSVIIMDIDHFKRVNDTYGHAAGDEVLRRLAERCRQGSRAVDLVGRYGGEEFLLLLPEAGLEAAYQVGERLKQWITGKPFKYDGAELRISISAGVAEMREDDTLQSLIDRADAALYEAKHTGRNRVVAK
ncbi:MAG: diguanylate cyclase, partial [Chloroflexota bacterium]